VKADRAYTGDAEVDRLLFRWGAVVRDAPQGWARGFALSIQRDRKKHGWAPTAKQLAVMHRMVAELPMTGPEDEPELIERD
jgi:hypothetical protein